MRWYIAYTQGHKNVFLERGWNPLFLTLAISKTCEVLINLVSSIRQNHTHHIPNLFETQPKKHYLTLLPEII